MFLLGIAVGLGREYAECPDKLRPSLERFDHVVYISSRSCDIGIGKFLTIFIDLLGKSFFRIGCLLYFLLENDLGSAMRTHDGYFCRRPGKIEIPADMFGIHDVVGPAVCFAHDERNFRYSRLTEGKEKFGAV